MSKTKSNAPRVRAIVKYSDEFKGRYKGHDIHIWWDYKRSAWYLTVTDADGYYAVDCWWREPERGGRIATLREAIVEACKGAKLWSNS